jgi:TolB-like protein
LRFGAFELDLASRELRSPAGAVRLQEQPFVILQLLVERRGVVVTREELRRKLWPEGTFVDFEHSLNAAIKRLRSVLGDDADNPQYVETIPRRGYRFVADEEDQESSGQRDVALAATGIRIAVLPFSDVGATADDDYFSHGFTEEMISELGRRGRGRFAVISSHSSSAYRDTSARALDIGLALRADYLLEGSVRRSGGRVRITARLVETATETQLWAETYEQPLTDWLTVQAQLAARIASSLAIELLPPAASRTPARDAAAYQSYLKGRYHYQRMADSGATEAFRFFQDAATRDPSLAAAHSGLALVEVMRASYWHEAGRSALARARAAADVALRLDDTHAEAHLVDGDVKRFLFWDHRGARAAYTTAIALNPSLESARTANARLLVSLRRFAQAVREADLGRELDPRCLTANTVAAWARYAAGDYGAASELCRHTLELDDRYAGARNLLSASLIQLGSLKDAIRVLHSEGNDDNAVLTTALVCALAANGERGAAVRALEELEQLERRRYVSPYHLAIAYTGVGDIDSAFVALTRASDDRDPAVTNIGIDPRLRPLQTDARYISLLNALHLRDFHASPSPSGAQPS